MNDKPNKRQAPADCLADLVSEELLAVSGKELMDAVSQWGITPAKAADNVDAAFKKALKQQAAVRLEQARRTRDAEISKMSGDDDFPQNKEELFVKLDARLAMIDPRCVTILHRDFNDLTVDDMRSMLRQLAVLEKDEPSERDDSDA